MKTFRWFEKWKFEITESLWMSILLRSFWTFPCSKLSIKTGLQLPQNPKLDIFQYFQYFLQDPKRSPMGPYRICNLNKHLLVPSAWWPVHLRCQRQTLYHMRSNLRLPVPNNIERVLPQIPICAARSCKGTTTQTINIHFAVFLDPHWAHIKQVRLGTVCTSHPKEKDALHGCPKQLGP